MQGAGNGSEVAGAGSAATALAFAAASREKADIYLEEQTKLARLQAEELSHELDLRHWSLWVRHLSGLLRLTLEIGLAVTALGLACFVAAAVWNAAHSDGLIIESFSVPPDLAARGLTGQVIAGQLTDKLSELQADTDSNRAPRSYSNDWGDDIKVEIPDTGVSIGEAYRFLRRWLGHETHVGGDVWRTQSGLAIATRVNGGGGTIAGTEADLDGLIQKTAEEIYNRTQPYRYAVYLQRHERTTEADGLRRKLAETGDVNERAWAYFSIAINQMNTGSPAEQERLFKLAVPHGPALALGNLGILEESLGRPELARLYYEQADARIRDSGGDINPDQRAVIANSYVTARLRYQSDYRAAMQEMEKSTGARFRSITNPAYQLAPVQLLDHDPAAARRTMESAALERNSNRLVWGANIRARFEAQMAMARAAEDWAGVLSLARAMNAALRDYPGQTALMPTADDPLTAIAEAKLGKFADAERRISSMPTDCYPCLMARARIADMQGQQAQSDGWFGRAVASNPSIPIAEAQWGLTLLGRNQPDAAIEKFKLSNKKGPHFADALEGWGEALMAKSQSHLALAKFQEAEKYAPNWGRLHLKWAEALYYAGKKDEARKQFARAAQLDLVAGDKAALGKWMASHGS